MTLSGEAPVPITRGCERLAALRIRAQQSISDMAPSLSEIEVEARLASLFAAAVASDNQS
jgi:hypothetical protein